MHFYTAMMKKYILLFLIFTNQIVIGYGQSESPNILLIVADDLGYSDLGFLPYASEDVQTPHIDRIAEKGVFFTNAYSTSPICSPSRVGLLTGRYHQRWGNYWYNEGGLPAREKTLPQFLKEQGYYNVKVGKTHLNGGPVEHPLDHGFDDFLGFIDHTWDYLRLSKSDVENYGKENAKKAHIGPLLDGREEKSFENSFTTDIFTKKTIRTILNKDDRPFYIHLSYNAVHHPTYVCHPDYLDKYGIEQFPFWDPDVESYQSWHKKWGRLGQVDPDGRKRYLLQLEVMDKGIGKILEALEETGEMDNTLIVFVSDNGGTINTYSQNDPLSGYKYMFGEGGIRVPLIISYPKKIKVKNTLNQTVSLMDILPTLLETVEGDIPENLDGKSLWPAINKNQKIHDQLVWSDGRDSWVVRKGKWKLARNIGWVHNTYKFENGVAFPAEKDYLFPGGTLLFDLENDIGETKNLAKKYPEIVNNLENIYTNWRLQMSDPRYGNGKLKSRPNPVKYVGNSLKQLEAEISSDGSQVDNYPGLIIDGYEDTFWKSPGGDGTKPLPHYVAIDLKTKKSFSTIKYTPAPDDVKNRVILYNIYISNDGKNWEKPVKSGPLPNSAHRVKINLEQQVSARYIKFEAVEVYGDSDEVAIAEIDIE